MCNKNLIIKVFGLFCFAFCLSQPLWASKGEYLLLDQASVAKKEPAVPYGHSVFEEFVTRGRKFKVSADVNAVKKDFKYMWENDPSVSSNPEKIRTPFLARCFVRHAVENSLANKMFDVLVKEERVRAEEERARNSALEPTVIARTDSESEEISSKESSQSISDADLRWRGRRDSDSPRELKSQASQENAQ